MKREKEMGITAVHVYSYDQGWTLVKQIALVLCHSIVVVVFKSARDMQSMTF